MSTFSLHGDPAAAFARLDARPVDPAAGRPRLFLVTRVDLSAQSHVAAFERLVAGIAERADRFAGIETLTITADASIVPDLLSLAGRMSAAMDAAFGPPAHVDNRAGYGRRVYR